MGTIRREGPRSRGNPQRLYVRDHLDRREIKIKSSCQGNLVDQLSEIPCRVVELPGVRVIALINRLKSVEPYRRCAGAAGHTEGKIAVTRSP
jgi:hypothetical protein